MRRTLLSGLMALPVLLAAQTVYFEDDFEAYVPDSFLCTQSTTWTTWDNMPGTATDAIVSAANAAMGVQSVILESPGGNGPSDLVLPMGDQTAGQWQVAFYIYVEPNNGGYFNLQKTEAPGTEWAIEVYFNADGSGTWTADNMDLPFTYTNGAWVHVEVWIDMDTDEARGFVEGSEVGAWQWSKKTDGNAGMNQLGGMNIYAAADAGPALFYIDEIEVIGPDAFATSIDEIEALSFELFPSPVVDVLNITVEDPQDLYLNVYDLTGKIVMQNVSMNVNTSTTKIDVSELNAGIYLLEMTNNKQRFTKRFVKE